jgi:hypothetical protein
VQRLFGDAPQSRDPQIFSGLDLMMDPGSAAHRYALRGVRGTQTARQKEGPLEAGLRRITDPKSDQAVL